MILAKACHDFDILQWLIGAPCVELNSYGALGHFNLEHAPCRATVAAPPRRRSSNPPATARGASPDKPFANPTAFS